MDKRAAQGTRVLREGERSPHEVPAAHLRREREDVVEESCERTSDSGDPARKLRATEAGVGGINDEGCAGREARIKGAG
jgi:hypothetical protein